MINEFRSTAENSNTYKPDSSGQSKEFFDRWLHRKQEKELQNSPESNLPKKNGKETISATRLSRALHNLDLQPKAKEAADAYNIREEGAQKNNELKIVHTSELSKRQETQNVEHVYSYQEQTDEIPDDIEEAVFDRRHEQLDHASSQIKPPVNQSDTDEEETQAAAHQAIRPVPLSSILAEKPYVKAKEIDTELKKIPIEQPPITKTYKTYILYGFIAGLVTVGIMTIIIL